MCDVCVAYPRMSFRIYGVSATYVWCILRINSVCATFVSLLWSMCGVLGVWRSKRILMLLYVCYRLFEVMDQMFLTVLCVVQGSFMAMLGVASIFVHVVLRPGWRA